VASFLKTNENEVLIPDVLVGL